MNSKVRNSITIIVLVIIPLIICGRIIWTKMRVRKYEEQRAKWRLTVWPAEKQQTEEKVKARQTVNETHGAVFIDLKPYINAKLTEATTCWKGNNANNYAELPAGTNIYAGVPFDVEGIVQLMGGWLKHYKKSYPARVEDIPIHRQCAKIHLFQGTAYVMPNSFGTNVAKLIIHYENNSTREINMIAGKQAFDSWWPTYTTGLPSWWPTPAPDTELAWVGSNKYIQQWAPDWTLCLYRSSFENPQPGVAISSLDYVSTETISCPFLIALTVE